jgi:transcriptional regulator with XRE-family HTH domain
MSFGLVLKLARTKEKMSQGKAAEKLGITRSYLSSVEADRGTPSFETVVKMDKLFPRNNLIEEYTKLIREKGENESKI